MSDAAKRQRVVALDLGKSRVGVAISDELGLLAHPRTALDGRNRSALLAALKRLVRVDGVGRFLVGLPLNMSGELGTAAHRAARFCQLLADATGVEVELVDERLSTVQAERALRAAGTRGGDMQGKVDGAAAAILLQHWLDQRRRHERGLA
ncbi:MAG TPA: Holliday junction resolvase RuvX [Sorangium sp.]|nr:Holliday junction resolvase RuvX [Sorangium sp.]